MFGYSLFFPAARLAALVVSLALSSVGALAADKATFAWPGAMSSGYAPFTFAQELGYFREENIELDTVLLQGAGTIIPQIANGSVLTGFITLSPLILARQPGAPNFEVKYVYNVVRASVWELAVLEAGPIRSVKDLAGKRIGVGGLAFGNVPFTKALLKAQGVDVGAVEFIPVGLGLPAFDALNRGKVDALNLYDIMNVLLEQRGTKIRRLALPKEFEQVSSYGFPVSSKVIAERPDLVARFGRAFTKGLVACRANPRGCLASYWKLKPDQRPVEMNDAAIARELSVLTVRLKNMISADDDVLGGFSDTDWMTTVAALMEGGQIATTSVKLDTLFTNRFVKDYNAFNRATVVTQARAYPGPK